MATKSKQKETKILAKETISKHSGTRAGVSGLWLVATPIGNARDITLRALDALTEADIIGCEDTRMTKKLLTIHGISGKKLVAYHDHNAETAGRTLISALESGKTVALVSDAGTPLINDPGFRLVAEAQKRGISVTSMPGPSAVITGLQLSGLASDQFHYAGFPPNKSAARRRFLTELAENPATLVFLESAKRLPASLADMKAVFGNRPAAVTRELTKAFEEIRRDGLDALTDHYEQAGPPKGEITIVVGGAGTGEVKQAPDGADLDDRLATLMQSLRMRDAVDALVAETGLPRRDIYQRALALKESG